MLITYLVQSKMKNVPFNLPPVNLFHKKLCIFMTRMKIFIPNLWHPRNHQINPYEWSQLIYFLGQTVQWIVRSNFSYISTWTLLGMVWWTVLDPELLSEHTERAVESLDGSHCSGLVVCFCLATSFSAAGQHAIWVK